MVEYKYTQNAVLLVTYARNGDIDIKFNLSDRKAASPTAECFQQVLEIIRD